MKQKNYNKSLIGGSIAFILATSCCWLPAILIAIGSGGAVMTFADQLGSWSLYFLLLQLHSLFWAAINTYMAIERKLCLNQPLPAQTVDIRKKKQCQQMPVSTFMNVKSARK